MCCVLESQERHCGSDAYCQPAREVWGERAGCLQPAVWGGTLCQGFNGASRLFAPAALGAWHDSIVQGGLLAQAILAGCAPPGCERKAHRREHSSYWAPRLPAARNAGRRAGRPAAGPVSRPRPPLRRQQASTQWPHLARQGQVPGRPRTAPAATRAPESRWQAPAKLHGVPGSRTAFAQVTCLPGARLPLCSPGLPTSACSARCPGKSHCQAGAGWRPLQHAHSAGLALQAGLPACRWAGWGWRSCWRAACRLPVLLAAMRPASRCAPQLAAWPS